MDTELKTDTAEGEPSNGSESSPTIIARTGEHRAYAYLEALSDEWQQKNDELINYDAFDDLYSAFWGDLAPKSLPSFKSPIVVNEPQLLILSEVSDLTDNNLTVYVQRDKSNPGRDEQVEKGFRAVWADQFVDQQVMLAALDGMIVNSGFVSCTWNPLLSQGQGDVCVRAVNPKSVAPDPDAEDDDSWRGVRLYNVLDIVEIREMWPDHGWRVKAEDQYSTKLKDESPSGGGARYKGPLYAPGSGLAAEGFMKARAGVIQLFIKDDQIVEEIEQELNPTTGPKNITVTSRQKYPNGRTMIGSNGVMLYDDVYPYWGGFPIIRVPMFPTTHSFWPQTSPLAGVIEIFKAANRLDSQIVENAIRLNNGLLIADANSGIDPSTFAGIPGQCILKRSGSSVEIKYPQPMPGDMVQGPERLRAAGRKVLSFPESRVGTGHRGNVSAELNETEISQGMSLSRLRGRLLHQAVQKLANQMFLRMAQFYTTPRHIPSTEGGKWELIEWKPIKSEFAKQYALHVDPSSIQVKSQTMVARILMALAKTGRVDDHDLFKALDLPDSQGMADRSMNRLAMSAQAKKNQKGGK